MTNEADVHLDVHRLRARGWTEALILRFLGAPDAMEPVDHWANFTGKRVYFLERVELAEASTAFGTAFKASVRRRKLNQAALDSFTSERRATAGNLHRWRQSRTGTDIKMAVIAERATDALAEAHHRGFRTPHKT